jgi:hypothetical protein
MTLPTGTITMAQVNTELSNPSTSTISLNDTDVRSLASIPSGTISMDDLRGTSAYTGITATGGSTFTIPSYPGSDSPTGRFKVHVFTGGGTFVVSDAPPAAPSVFYWITGGGGGGGMPSSYTLSPNPYEIIGFTGGGAGGGRRTGTAPVNAQSYPITIGAGGTVTRNPQPPTTPAIRVQGTPGGISSALSVSVHGGGTPNPGPISPTDQTSSGGAEIFYRSPYPNPSSPSGVQRSASGVFKPFGGPGGSVYGYLPGPYNTYFGGSPSRQITYFLQSAGGGGGPGTPGGVSGLAIRSPLNKLNDPSYPTSAPIPTYQPAFPITSPPTYFNPGTPFLQPGAQGQGSPGGAIFNVPAPTIAPAIPAPQRPAWIAAVTDGSNTKVGGGGGGSGFYHRKSVSFYDNNVSSGIPVTNARATAESLIHSLIAPNLPTIGIGQNGGGDGRAYFSPTQMNPPTPSDPTIDRDATAGLANTGGGGGGMNWDLVGVVIGLDVVPVPWPSDPTSGNGGSGIVIIGYPAI